MTYKVGRCLLRYHLAKKRMSQQELADLVGITKQSVSRYVKDAHVMSFETAYNIAKVLGCKMEDLYDYRK
jgi:DNA-binding XRE family transcriptional regulator